jgi:putative heme transporter
MRAVHIADTARREHGGPVVRSRRHQAVRWTVALGAIALEVGLVAPRLTKHAAAVDGIRWSWVVVAVAAEAASVVAVGALYRPLLRAGGVSVTRRRSMATGATASAITAMVPAGPVASSAYLYRQFRRAGSSSALAGWAVTATTGLGLIAFGVVTGTAALLGNDYSVGAAIRSGALGLLAMVVLVGLSAMLTRHARPILRVASETVGRIVHRGADKAGCDEWLNRVVTQLGAIRPGLRQWTPALALAVLTWASDLTCFVLCLHAVGINYVDVGAVALAYGAGLATTGVNVMPAGIGTVEAGMLLGLTHAGVAASAAFAGILTYRLVAYVLVGVAGWAIWAAVRRRSRAVPELKPIRW